MKNIGFLLAVVVLLSTLGGCNGAITHIPDTRRGLDVTDKTKAEPAAANGDLKVTLDATYKSRNIWRGFDWYSRNHSAIQPSIDIDFWGTGFGTNILWSRAVHSGFENKQWLVYNPYYRNSFWQGERYQMDYKAGWRYYNGPDGSIADNFCHPRDSDFQEFYGRFSWPRVCSTGFVPYYEAARIWPDKGGRRQDGCPKSYWRTYGGWFHTFGLEKDWKITWLPDISNQVLHTGFEMVFNDGAGPTPDSRRDNVDHDWSHAVFRLSTDFYLRPNIIFTPAFHLQKSMDDSVNTSDECWTTLNMRLIF